MKFPGPIEFIWEKANKFKNLEKHNVSVDEIERVFFDEKKRTFPDKVHSGNELRYRVVGKTKKGRLLFVVFMIRRNKIRIISVRDLNKKEYILYEKRA